jgi:hypothetical protein
MPPWWAEKFLAAKARNREPMRNTGVKSPAIVLALAAIIFPLAPPLLARAQNSQDSVTLLTTGIWMFHGLPRIFHPDGTWTCRTRTHGTWHLEGNTLEVFEGNTLEVSWERSFDSFPLPLDPNGTNGISSSGRVYVLSQAAENEGDADATDTLSRNQDYVSSRATHYIPKDAQQSAAQVMQSHAGSLVVVTGSAAAGSGFIVTLGGANYLVTNAHVAAGIRDAAFKTLHGTMVQGGAASVAVGEDIFCMAMGAGGRPFEVMQNVDANAAVGDDVVVLGNAEGEGVVNTIIGRIVGIGPNLVEIDAPFVPGNSGSPIVHLKSGKVIGVATYTVTNQYDLTTNRRLKRPIVRRFGYRLDSVTGWQRVNWRAFDAQAVEMENIEGLTDDLYDFFRGLAENNGRMTPGQTTNRIIKDLIYEWIDDTSHHASPEDKIQADQSFLSSLKVVCQSDVSTAQNQISYDYFARELADQRQTRDEMAKAIGDLIQSRY